MNQQFQSFQQRQFQGQNLTCDFACEFYIKGLKEELIVMILKLFLKTKEIGTFPNPFYEGRFMLIPKLDKKRATRIEIIVQCPHE